MYGDEYTQIHPNYIGHNNNSVSKEWPPMKALLWAYYNGDYDIKALRNFNETTQYKENDDIVLAEDNSKEKELLRFRLDLERKPEEISKKLGYKDIVQNNPHHIGTLNQHVDAVINSMPEDASDLAKIAACFHDIGKFETIAVNQKTGYSQFIGHANKSVEIITSNRETLCPTLSDEEFDYMKELVRLHDTKYNKQGKCQTMLNEHPNGFAKDLIALQYADIMGQSEYNKEQKLQEVKTFAGFIEQIGTPEQTKGLKDVIDIIDNAIIKTREVQLDSKDREFLARTASNVDVYIDEETMEHLKAHSEVNIAHIREAISQTYFEPNSDGSFCKTSESIDLHKITGHDSLIEITSDNQELVQSLYRIDRDNPSNVIIGEAPETTKLMVAYGQIPEQGVMLFTACAGELAPPESDKEFWSKHALICSKDVIDWERSAEILQQSQSQIDRLETKSAMSIEQLFETIEQPSDSDDKAPNLEQKNESQSQTDRLETKSAMTIEQLFETIEQPSDSDDKAPNLEQKNEIDDEIR